MFCFVFVVCFLFEGTLGIAFRLSKTAISKKVGTFSGTVSDIGLNSCTNACLGTVHYLRGRGGAGESSNV